MGVESLDVVLVYRELKNLWNIAVIVAGSVIISPDGFRREITTGGLSSL